MNKFKIAVEFAIAMAVSGYFAAVLPKAPTVLAGVILVVAGLLATRSWAAQSSARAWGGVFQVLLPLMAWPAIDIGIKLLLGQQIWPVGPQGSDVVITLSAGIAACAVFALDAGAAGEGYRLRASIVALLVVGYATVRTLPFGANVHAAACLALAIAFGVVQYPLVVPPLQRRLLLSCVAAALLGAAVCSARPFL